MDPKLANHLASAEFRLFKDEELRNRAIVTVDRIIRELNDERLKLVKRSQIHSIAATIQAHGIGGLVVLAKHQKEKNTKKENEKFWSLLYQHLTDLDDPESLRPIAIRILTPLQIVKDVKSIQDKGEQGRQKTLNKEAIDAFLDAITATYFEHFVCHFFYCHKGVNHG